MQVVIGCQDRYLGANLTRLVRDAGLRSIRTAKMERIISEIKRPERVTIIDVNWEKVQEHGLLKQIVNISRITGNRVVCICPNQDEELKKLAKASGAHEVYIRFDLEGPFKEFLKTI